MEIGSSINLLINLTEADRVTNTWRLSVLVDQPWNLLERTVREVDPTVRDISLVELRGGQPERGRGDYHRHYDETTAALEVLPILSEVLNEAVRAATRLRQRILDVVPPGAGSIASCGAAHLYPDVSETHDMPAGLRFAEEFIIRRSKAVEVQSVVVHVPPKHSALDKTPVSDRWINALTLDRDEPASATAFEYQVDTASLSAN